MMIPLAGDAQAGFAEEQAAWDNRLGLAEYRMGGRFQTGRPAHCPDMVSQTSLTPKRTSLSKVRCSLNRKRRMSVSR